MAEFTRSIEESGVDLAQVDLVASHGQTLWHHPVGEKRSTLQMAEPAMISYGTKRTVISGFRVAELAAGRQGAPLSGFFEAGLLSNPELTRISQNIGGIGNATVLPASNVKTADSDSKYFAFDTGPGNVFIDAAMRILTNNKEQFDCDGILGARGETEIDNAVVEDYLTNEPYFQLQPPKTTGRELFSDDVARGLVEKMQSSGKSPEAIIATITRITAESIARAYESIVLPRLDESRRNIDEIYICGGGAYNPNILKHLRARFPQSKVMRLDDDDGPTKLNPSAKEAVLFALLGFLCVSGRSVPIAMDAETVESSVMGVVTPGENYRHVMEMVVRDQEFAKAGILGSILM
ncbi:uncharacterized protein PFLUO_LOCUS9309 [Penicillium psychrofluorescens]|uniref:uncharacterized protein n=1 Tax=Penicillium psychrofluorescens TaxID=3158075 RepID=UPI003CCD774B